jgi:hypothetical protein
MKKLITCCLLVLFAVAGKAQFSIDFENGNDSIYLSIDTTDTNNVWQIGKPQKTLFDSAFSLPNAILTDTINSYPVNDTSVFYVWYTNHLQFWSPILHFRFKINADSLNDYGIIEASPDSGQTWVNITNNNNYGWDITSFSQGNWIASDSIPFTGTSDGWYVFELGMYSWDNDFGYNDSILYRFTFISDNIETNQEGWIIDNINMWDIISNVEELNNNTENHSRIFPNPLTEESILQTTNNETIERINIYSALGKKLNTIIKPNETAISINKNEYYSGIFIYEIITINKNT